MSETEVDRLLVRIVADASLLKAEFAKAVKQTEQSSQKMAGAAGIVGKAWQAAGSNLTKYLGTAALVAFSVKVLKVTADLGDQAQQAGVTVEGLQAYRSALAQNGVEAGTTDRILARLNDRIGSALKGSKEARDGFTAVGVSIQDIAKAGGTVEGVMPLIARGLASIGSESRRTAAANDIFGEKIGKMLIPALGELGVSADQVIRKMKELGLVISDETAKKATDALNQMGQAFVRLETAAAPPLTWIAEKLAEILGLASKIATSGVWDIPQKQLGQLAGKGDLGARVELQRRAGAAGIPFAGIPGAPIITPQISALQSGQGDDAKNAAAAARSQLVQKAGQAGVAGADRFGEEELNALIQFHEDATAADDRFQEGLIGRNQQSQDIIQASKDAAAVRQHDRLEAYKTQLSEQITTELDANREVVGEIGNLWDDYYQRQAEKRQEASDQSKEQFTNLIVNDIEQFGYAATQGSKAFLQAFAQMILQVIALIVKLRIAKALSGDMGAGGSGGGGDILGSIAGAFLGGGSSAAPTAVTPYAEGGPISRGQLAVVGEKRPELFIPSVAGRIVPGVTGATVHLHQTIQLMPSASEVARREIMKAMPLIGAHSVAAVHQAMRRGSL